jgi:hypothetical protein
MAAQVVRNDGAAPQELDDGRVVEVIRRLVRTDGGHVIESSMTMRRIPDPRLPAEPT